MKRYILALTVFAAACTGTQKSTMNKDEIKALHFGSGGGVTGAWTEYSLLPNGNLQKIGRKHSAENLPAVDEKVAKELFTEAAAIKAAPYNKPGNITQFVDIIKSDTTYHFAWAASDAKADAAVLQLYKKLSMLAK